MEGEDRRRLGQRVEHRAREHLDTGCAWYSNEVATPKLPPPPRSAQNRSECSSSLAVITLAVGGDDLDATGGCRW